VSATAALEMSAQARSTRDQVRGFKFDASVGVAARPQPQEVGHSQSKEARDNVIHFKGARPAPLIPFDDAAGRDALDRF
jgi:hypothetical protein